MIVDRDKLEARLGLQAAARLVADGSKPDPARDERVFAELAPPPAADASPPSELERARREPRVLGY